MKVKNPAGLPNLTSPNLPVEQAPPPLGLGQTGSSPVDVFQGEGPTPLEAFQRLVGVLTQAPPTLLQTGNEEAIADFLKQGRWDQTQVLQDLRTVANTMSRMPAGQEVVLGQSPQGSVTLSPQQGLQAQGQTGKSWTVGDQSVVHTQGPLGSAVSQAAWNAKFGADAKGKASFGPDGLNAQGQAWAGGQSKGTLQSNLDFTLGTADLKAQGDVAAEAWGQGRVEANLKDGLKAQGQAGAEARLGGSLDANVQTALFQSNTRIEAGGVIGAKGQGNVQADLNGVHANAKVGAQAEVAIQAKNDTRTAGVLVGGERLDVNSHVKAVAKAGASAKAEMDVTATIAPPRAGLEVEAGAFAGAKAGVEGKVGLGDFVAVKGKAEAWAGAGAQAGLIAGLKDGKLRFGFHAGAAVEAGAGFEWSVEVDIEKITKAMIGGSLEAAQRGLEFAVNPLGASLKTANEVATLLSGKTPGTLDLGGDGAVPLAAMAQPLVQQTQIQQQASELVSQAVTDLLGPAAAQEG